MQFILTITCDSAAFNDPDGQPNDYDRASEVQRILHRAIEKLGDDYTRTRLPLLDTNGVLVGGAVFEEA